MLTQTISKERTVEYISYGLVALTVLLYSRVGSFDFVNFDDNSYVYLNATISKGLTWPGIVWSFTALHGDTSYWHPITWISHMLDVQMFGLDAGAHHLVNVLIHIANTLIIFGIFCRETSAVVRSAVLAGLFAWHPSHVESVAWIAERKDLLCAFFILLGLYSYTTYSRRCNSTSYALTLAWFSMAIMSKPMAVTFPLMLVVFDYWPLNRFANTSNSVSVSSSAKLHSKLLYEKIPFVIVASFAALITIIAQRDVGAMAALDSLPLLNRFENAAVSYVEYIWMAFCPIDLCIFYSYSQRSFVAVSICVVFLIAGTVGAYRLRYRMPWLIAGWLWFVGTLLPVIGLIQVGGQALADRYTYLPFIGLFWMVVWSVPRLSDSVSALDTRVTGIVVLILTVLCALTYKQVSHWENTLTLFKRALDVDGKNILALKQVAQEYISRRQIKEAVETVEMGLVHWPRDSNLLSLRGKALVQAGSLVESAQFFYAAIAVDPNNCDAYFDLASVLLKQVSVSNRPPDLTREALRNAALGCSLAKVPSSRMLMLLGEAYKAEGRDKEAFGVWRRGYSAALQERDWRTAYQLKTLHPELPAFNDPLKEK